MSMATSGRTSNQTVVRDSFEKPNAPSVEEEHGLFGFFTRMVSRFQQFTGQVAKSTSDLVNRGLSMVGLVRGGSINHDLPWNRSRSGFVPSPNVDRIMSQTIFG